MDMKEKLMELLSGDMCKDCYCEDCEHENNEKACIEHIKSRMANHLIANGVGFVTDNNVGGKWIPVTERLPEEHGSIFVSFYGTAKWQDGMFLKCSDTVLASVEYEDGKRRVKAIITKDGKWDFSRFYRASKVTHWMPLPEPPKEVDHGQA